MAFEGRKRLESHLHLGAGKKFCWEGVFWRKLENWNPYCVMIVLNSTGKRIEKELQSRKGIGFSTRI